MTGVQVLTGTVLKYRYYFARLLLYPRPVSVPDTEIKILIVMKLQFPVTPLKLTTFKFD